MQAIDSRKFKPAASKGGLFSIICLLFVVGIMSGVFIPIMFATNDMTIIVFGSSFIAGMAILFLFVVHGYYTMAYIASGGRLLLRWGPFITSIPIKSIMEIGTTASSKLDGIRTGGVGIPGHLYGAFKILIDGKYRAIKLYATKISNLVIITTNDGKCYGVTPQDPAAFIAAVKELGSQPVEKTFDNEASLVELPEKAKKYGVACNLLFVMVFTEIGIAFACLAIIYPQLPEIVPLHFDLAGIPNRWGSKSELIWPWAFLFSIVAGLNTLLHISIRRQSQLTKSKWGIIIMMIPVAMCTTFLVLNLMLYPLMTNPA